MKALILGAGRMGIRHLQGLLTVKEIESVTLLDIKQEALDTAKEIVQNDNRVNYCIIDQYKPTDNDLCIIASTADSRKSLCDLAAQCKCQYVMIEKPLGQSLKEVEKTVEYLNNMPYKTVVNLNMRLNSAVIKLKNDLKAWPQFQGEKVITLNTGSLGIGCNGIHFLDFLFYILDADKAELVHAEVDNTLIQSGRGANFCDFGGWAIINYSKNDIILGKTFLSMSAKSSVFGGWEIVAPYGSISIDEITQKRINICRKEDSSMPIYRYAADYLPPQEEPFISPMLGDLTALWVSELLKGNNLLPDINESVMAHKLMFDWLSYSKTHKNIFPIT
jgi:Predicted dehydrogenases and related proteins